MGDDSEVKHREAGGSSDSGYVREGAAQVECSHLEQCDSVRRQLQDGMQHSTGQSADKAAHAATPSYQSRDGHNSDFVTAMTTEGTQHSTGQSSDKAAHVATRSSQSRDGHNSDFVTAMTTEGTQHSTGQSADKAAHVATPSSQSRDGHNVDFVTAMPTEGMQFGLTGSAVDSGQTDSYIVFMAKLHEEVQETGLYNFSGARRPVPSGLNLEAWKRYLTEYGDAAITDYLEFGWPINFNRSSPLIPTDKNHFSATAYPEHIDYYIATELAHRALLGPFSGPPVGGGTHTSPLMTRDKKNSEHRRVIVDLSFPNGYSINDGIDTVNYIDGPLTVKLPSVHTMEQRVLALGAGAFLYKTDLARGYRQLRIDPADWGLLAFMHRGNYYVDVCPPFGLRSSAMMMVRTTQAVTYIHKLKGYTSIAYIDDFGGGRA